VTPVRLAIVAPPAVAEISKMPVAPERFTVPVAGRAPVPASASVPEAMVVAPE